jgi:hypothetical protein
MKHAIPGILLFGVLGCSDGAEIPTVELGGSGARLMNGQGRTPRESYENAYDQIHRQHYNVRRNLEARGQSLFGARAALDAIVNALETMKALAGPSDRPRFDPYIARYKGWSADVGANRWGGSFIQDVDRSEYELKSKFSPDNVEIVADFSAAQGGAAAQAAPAPPAPAPAPAVAPSPGVPDDKAVIPARPVPAPVPPTAVPAPAPAPAPGTSNVAAARLFFKAWDRSHDDLLTAYKAKKDCRVSYEDVAGALRQLHANIAPEKRAKLQIYLDYYAGIHEKTKGFSTLPEGEKISEKDIVDELDVAARVIRKEFNPDK